MFLNTKQMRNFATLVADVLDEMLAADFEDGFASPAHDDEIDGSSTAAEHGQLFPTRPCFPRRFEPGVRSQQARSRRPGEVPQSPTPCISPVSPRGIAPHKRG